MKHELRRTMRAARRALSEADRHLAAEALSARIQSTRWFRDSRSLAAYLPFDSEIDPRPFMTCAAELDKQVYLPIVRPNGGLLFARWARGMQLHPNRFGIPEPPLANARCIDPRSLDLVLTPLVAFDAQGRRIGMGAGFYDRTFSFLNTQPRAARPMLVGTAYDMQRVEHIDADPWDVTLDAVATEERVYDLRNRPASNP